MPLDISEANKILDFELGKRNTMPAHDKVYIGLSSTDPEEDGGTFTELSGGKYARVLINQYNSEYPGLIGNAAGRVIASIKQINWTKETVQQTAKGFGLFTAATGGTPFFSGKLTGGELTIAPGAVALFEAGNFKIGFSDKDEAIE